MNYGGVLLDPETERAKTCTCGNVFAQWRLHPKSLEAASMGAVRVFALQVPGGYVPVYCPRCERDQLRLEANRASMRITYGGAA